MQAHPLVERAVASLRLGEPVARGALALVPVRIAEDARPPKTYWTLAEARARGLVSVTELGRASVPSLAASVIGPAPVLFVEGEILLGGLQNRIVNASVLAGTRHTSRIPVSCVERGRWARRTDVFEPAPGFGCSALRARKNEGVTQSLDYSSDQTVVWDEVDRALTSSSCESATSSVDTIYESRADELERIASSLVVPLLASGLDRTTVGVVALRGGRFLGADVFDRPGTFRRLADRLVRGYAVDVLGASREPADPEAMRFTAAERLASAAASSVRSRAAAGLGTDHRVEGDGLQGFALEHAGRVVHLAVFPKSCY